MKYLNLNRIEHTLSFALDEAYKHNELMEEHKENIPNEVINKEFIKNLLGENPECEIEFTATIKDEVPLSVDPVDGSLKSSEVEEEETGFIQIELEDTEYHVTCQWESFHFEAEDECKCKSIDEICDFILDYTQRFNEFLFEYIYR